MVSAKTKFPLESLKIKYNGLFDFGELINFLRSWMKNEYYIFVESKHKYRPDEKEVEMIGFRKLDEYVKYTISILVLAEDVKDVEIIKEGKKLNTNEGKVIITFNGVMDLDWQKQFQGRFWVFLQDFYHKYIIKNKIENEWLDPFEKDLFRFRNDVKAKFFEDD